ncbi:RNA recognition motif domain-containing protein [Candidatus Margulisiibacteriota bacterium]
MAKTLYVGNLPWKMKEEELVAAIEAQAPVIAARIITERETGRSKGYGFVEVNDDDATKVVSAMNGADIGGRTLTVNEARPRQNKAF